MKSIARAQAGPGNGFQWILMDLDGSGRILMDLDGFRWIWMDLDGFGLILNCVLLCFNGFGFVVFQRIYINFPMIFYEFGHCKKTLYLEPPCIQDL